MCEGIATLTPVPTNGLIELWISLRGLERHIHDQSSCLSTDSSVGEGVNYEQWPLGHRRGIKKQHCSVTS